GKIKSTISITNYKNKPQSFELYAALPDERELGEIKPEAQKVEEEYIMWKIEKIKPAEKIELSFQLMGMEKGDFEENILYVRGIDPVNVIGAEKWEGD
ncbi:MAG: DNA topoisomerase VI subunit B, partial [Thermoplasmata archaeon]